MPTPKSGYYVDGERIPSVTTVLSRFKESGGLIYWSWNTAFVGLTEARSVIEDLTQEGQRTTEAQKRAREFLTRPLTDWDYRAKRDEAADAGTVAHEMMDCHIHNRPFDAAQYLAPIIKLAEPAFGAFLTWAKQVKFTVTETEVALVSRKYRFGGTRDAIFIDDKRAVGDWKTSKSIYPEYLGQLAAYGILDEEAGNVIEGGYHLLKFSKQEKPDDPVHFSHHYWSQLDAAREAFLLMRKLYDLMSDLKRIVK
jgi:hypothetical protein